MSKYSIGSVYPDGKKTKCQWKGCKPNTHETRIKYPKGGVVWRDAYTGTWMHPSGLYEQKASLLYWYNRGGQTAVTHKLNSYTIRKHHVIPVNVMTKTLKNISHNLDLLSWDMNNGDSNGICLPFFYADMAWHDLQVHRGSHPNYDLDVESSLNNLESECLKYCKTDSQDDILGKVKAKVTLFKKKLIKWRIVLHASTLAERAKL